MLLSPTVEFGALNLAALETGKIILQIGVRSECTMRYLDRKVVRFEVWLKLGA